MERRITVSLAWFEWDRICELLAEVEDKSAEEFSAAGSLQSALTDESRLTAYHEWKTSEESKGTER